uniref:CCHC-type domain-containing protein n=1 Tax=Strongyloides venezuelensis TaxID=75913 RepID=A0A0K0FFG0_STRVS
MNVFVLGKNEHGYKYHKKIGCGLLCISDTWRLAAEESDTDPETVSDNLFTRSINVIRNNLFGHHFEDSGDVSSDNQSFGVSDGVSSVDNLLISGLLDLSVSVAEGARCNDGIDPNDMVEGKAWVLYPAYEEKNGSMKNYVRKLELIMECDDVKSASTKMNILKSKLSDETLDEFDQLVDSEQVSTYDTLKEWLCNRFSDDLSVSNAMIKLRGFHIRVDESHLSKDLSEVAELVMKSSSSKSQSDIVNRTKERFMDKIGDDELFKRLLSKDYSSVSEMINDLCTVFMLNNKRRNDNLKKMRDKRVTSNDSGNRSVKFNGTCHSCGIKGHKAAECRKKRHDNVKFLDKSQQPKINSNITIIKHNTLPLIKCHVKSSQAIALVDTSANIGLIRQSLVLRQDLPIKTSTVKIRQTFGSKAETLGYVDAPITINDVTKRVRLEVISDRNTDQGYDILLDTKAIKDFQLIIDLANNSMKAGDTHLDMCYIENESDSINTLQFNHSVISKELALERIFEKNPDAENAIVGDGNTVPCSQFEAPVQHFTTDIPHRFIKYAVPFNLKHICQAINLS